jgi:hypothetical protein
MAAGHAWMVGSNRNALWFQAGLALLVGLAVYPGVLRIAHALEKRRARQTRAAHVSRQEVRAS